MCCPRGAEWIACTDRQINPTLGEPDGNQPVGNYEMRFAIMLLAFQPGLKTSLDSVLEPFPELIETGGYFYLGKCG